MKKIRVMVLVISIVLISTTNRAQMTKESNRDILVVSRENSYDQYLQNYGKYEHPDTNVFIQMGKDIVDSEGIKIVSHYESSTGESVVMDESGFVEWAVEVEQEGLYNLFIAYYPMEGRSSTIERSISINDQIPFDGASNIVFNRVWVDIEPIKKDARGNDVRPMQVEVPRWQTQYISDAMGYYTEPYAFYFKKGRNTIRLESVREPMVINQLALKQAKTVPTYEEIKTIYDAKGYQPVEQQVIKIQAEQAAYKSDPTLYAITDRSSPATEPNHGSKIALNAIGGEKWKTPGQTITWVFDVPESGLYNIALKERQNFQSGLYVSRKLMIDGEAPFKEMENLNFNYENAWRVTPLKDETEPYSFYLEKGTHELTLEVTLGDLSHIIRVVEDSVYQLNSIYRKILMITGSSPDKYRDYALDKKLPKEMEVLTYQSNVLAEVSNMLIEQVGKKGANSAILDKLSYQLKDFAQKPYKIPKSFKTFKDNISSLGTWLLESREQKLELDYILITSPGTPLPKADHGFLKKMAHEAELFIYSFFEDYNSIGDVEDGEEVLTVWIDTGRDQAQVLKNMIDDTFTPRSGVKVNLRLVAPNVLLPATVAGRGPDVAVQAFNQIAVNYAIRNAVQDLTAFSDFDSVKDRFYKSAMVPFEFEGGYYGLPETQVYPMLFYRTDIFKELNLEPPQTWQDVYDILPVIQKKYMDFVIPVSTPGLPQNGGRPGLGLQSYQMYLYQNGGTLYKEKGMSSALNQEAAIASFKKWTALFTNYKLPIEYNFFNRFRIGEVPIGISDFTVYNQLAVAAPEIRGLWEFIPIPGTRKEDGTIDRSTGSNGQTCIMLKSSQYKEEAWAFMKWWTSADAQIRYAREMESIMGAAARYPTANVEALKQLPWPYKDYVSLSQQWEWVKGVPEVPGGYFTPRHMDNAFRSVLYEGEDPRETLLDYVLIINQEIDTKRKEFGLELDPDRYENKEVTE
ncbi:extracellular solute-binding protein [Vallitalea pronyensis]|uniref:Extracellular solute-binding protein n=1 Tax=Vallitalea pronyensis TaxID=1348613 RepID=A0A8J8MIX4_9FIRM|nr:extracellular solute-binding protein [Vallitalea pronyensis]QUI22291.1 extracellular solute-binding protein [Vallitalea pronyensis]